MCSMYWCSWSLGCRRCDLWPGSMAIHPHAASCNHLSPPPRNNTSTHRSLHAGLEAVALVHGPRRGSESLSVTSQSQQFRSVAVITIKAPWQLCGRRCEVDEGRRRSACRAGNYGRRLGASWRRHRFRRLGVRLVSCMQLNLAPKGCSDVAAGRRTFCRRE